jgi:hypothetical protein
LEVSDEWGGYPPLYREGGCGRPNFSKSMWDWILGPRHSIRQLGRKRRAFAVARKSWNCINKVLESAAPQGSARQHNVAAPWCLARQECAAVLKFYEIQYAPSAKVEVWPVARQHEPAAPRATARQSSPAAPCGVARQSSSADVTCASTRDRLCRATPHGAAGQLCRAVAHGAAGSCCRATG